MSEKVEERSTFDLAALLRKKQNLSLREQIAYVWRLSVPGILAQISSILMQYIDAAMVGKLGAQRAASIGLVASSTWLFGGLVHACATGFTVQVAQAVGAGSYSRARSVLRQAIVVCTAFSLVLFALGASIAGALPRWLGAEEAVRADASRYFLIFVAALPLWQLGVLLRGMLQCSGNMKVPGLLSVLMCALDVAFNFLFIFVLHLGVTGAALGTVAAELAVLLFLAYFCLWKSPLLHLRARRDEPANVSQRPDLFFERWRVQKDCLCEARRIAVPMAFEQFALCGAQIASMRIIAPLGMVSIAADSFGITAESLCYMPGYGISGAATTLVGQSVGARRKDLARHFAWVTIFAGMAIMALSAVIMYFASPAVMGFLTPDESVRALGVEILRIEMFAEPLFAASIVASGALRGAGDTLVPGIMNLVSMWGVRLTLALALTPRFGLKGAWIAMAVELCFRGVLFLLRVKRERWLQHI